MLPEAPINCWPEPMLLCDKRVLPKDESDEANILARPDNNDSVRLFSTEPRRLLLALRLPPK